MTELVHLDVSDGVARITLDSPANRNALSVQVRAELATHLESAIGDDAARVIVLGHTGPAFCAGLDLTEVAGTGAGPAVGELAEILDRIWTSPTPVVAALAGPVRAGGVGLVAAADIAVAASDVSFAFTEVRLGVVPAVISVTVLPRVLPHAAHELFLTGEVFDAARAAAIGLINSAVSADALEAEVGRYVAALLLGAPDAMAATKRLVRESLAAELARMGALSAQSFASAEAAEGIRARAEKRPPAWAAGSPATTGAQPDARRS